MLMTLFYQYLLKALEMLGFLIRLAEDNSGLLLIGQ